MQSISRICINIFNDCRFPKDDRRLLWIAAVKRQNWTPSDYSGVCAVHFPTDAFDHSSQHLIRLKHNAIPCINIPDGNTSPVLTEDINNVPQSTKRQCCDDELPVSKKLRAVVSSEMQTIRINSRSVCTQTLERCTTKKANKSSTTSTGINTDKFWKKPTKNKKMQTSITPLRVKMHDMATQTVTEMSSRSKVIMTPRKKALALKLQSSKEVVVSLRKRVKTLHQSKRRLVKKVADLVHVLKALRTKFAMPEEHLLLLENMSAMNKDLLKRVEAKGNSKAVPNKYSPELRKFALTLNFYSPRAYSYVRKCFDTCLPHPRTVSKWYQTINGEPGFTKEAMNVMTLKAANSENPLLCSLVMDEMAIRKNIEFDGKQFHGYVDLGTGVSDDSMDIAREALTLMLVGINGHWKLPIGYFLINGLSGMERSNIVKQCLSTVHATGVVVVSLTFDGTASNFTMAKLLGCVFNPFGEMKTTFPHPSTGEPVAVFLDPCHMIKLVRNALGDLKTISDGKKNISWEYIAKLHNIQAEEGLHLGNKLKEAHINWRKQKMKVKLATQVFSDSVADAISTCQLLKIAGFEHSEATVTFVKNMNILFDIFNSRNVLAKGWKAPLRKENYGNISTFLSYMYEYITQLRISINGPPIVLGIRKTGFLGFMICIKSVLGIYERLLSRNEAFLKYLPMYKVSQDHIELLFGEIRSHGGHNNNPTARQFMGAYKKLLVHNEVSNAGTGNCIPLENLEILHVGSGMHIINSTANNDCDDDVFYTQHMQEHAYCLDPRVLTLCQENVVGYIAGYVVRKAEKNLKCDICRSALRGQFHCKPSFTLLNSKNRGGLVYPSADVMAVCSESEKVFREALSCSGEKKILPKFTIHKCTSNVLNYFLNREIFASLNDHMFSQSPLENHIIQLIRVIATTFLEIRFFYVGKRFTSAAMNGNIRHMYTKLVIFKGQ